MEFGDPATLRCNAPPLDAEQEVNVPPTEREPPVGTTAAIAPPFAAEQEVKEEPDSIVREEMESLEIAAPFPLVREMEETETEREAVTPLPEREMSGRIDWTESWVEDAIEIEARWNAPLSTEKREAVSVEAEIKKSIDEN